MATRTASCNCGQLTAVYEGPDPERVSLCQCYECQRRTGSVVAVQTRLPDELVTIEGRSSTWTFPSSDRKPAEFRSCDSAGATYHFCPKCGSTVYWDLAIAPGFIGFAVGAFTDATFPTPVISGFEAYGPSWVMNISELSIPHHGYDGTSHGGPRL